MSAQCNFDSCKKLNIDTTLVTRDAMGCRLFCFEHWNLINLMFTAGIPGCIRSGGDCWRNHLADLYESERGLNSVRFDGKYYNLCDKHIRVYENLLSLWLV